MGVELDFDLGKTSSVDLSPNTVLPPLRKCSIIEKRVKLNRKDDILILKDDFTKVSLVRYRSSSCRSNPSKAVGHEGYVDIKRGSVYQSSRAISKMKERRDRNEREKIEISSGSDNSMYFEIVDSLCGYNEESIQKRSSRLSMNSELNRMADDEDRWESTSSNGFIDFSLCSDNVDKLHRKSLQSDILAGPFNNGDKVVEQSVIEPPVIEPPVPSYPSDSDNSAKSRFSPIRKIFNPIMKSKSLKSPSSYVSELGELKKVRASDLRRNLTYRKALLQDFDKAAKSSELESQFTTIVKHRSLVSSSPVHLHGLLKSVNRHGVLYYEFSLNSREDGFVAKTWKTENDFNWFYTFHYIDQQKKSDASRWKFDGSSRSSSMVGQMQVSSYFTTDLRDGDFANSMVTELVVYDTVRARNCVSTQEDGNSTYDSVKNSKTSKPGSVEKDSNLNGRSHPIRPKIQQIHAFESPDHGSLNGHPLASVDLHPNFETAAIVMQIPFEDRESSKQKRQGEHRERVKVVITSGSHGLPSAETKGPSPLLDRWRLGGGCDCGGWDMACPLIILGIPDINSSKVQQLMENQEPFELFIQGAKENTPGLAITMAEEGKFHVDFHAQLSTLQAFSICVALLHGREACKEFWQLKSKQLTQHNPLKMLIEEEAILLINEAMVEEKRKGNPPSFVPNPSFQRYHEFRFDKS